MSVTEQDIETHTPEHRIVWKEPVAPRELEMGLWMDGGGTLRTDAGHVVRWKGGAVPESVRARTVRIIEPAFTPRRGLVIRKPGSVAGCLMRVDEPNENSTPWLGYAPELDIDRHWFTDSEARDLIENHGWKVVDDLTKEKSDD